MDILRTLATLLPLSLAAGVNLYGTVLIVGLCIRLGWVTNVPSGLEVLGSVPVIIIAGLLYLIEFVADKIPFVDNVWDAIHTVVRPLGAALLAASAFARVHPVVAVIAALLAGGIALVSHSGKAGARAVLNTASPVENVSNIAVSVVEDVGVGALALLALKYPFVAAGIGAVLLVLLLILVPRLLRWMSFTLRAIWARVRGFVAPRHEPDTLPTSHMVLLGHRRPELAARCQAQQVPGAAGRSGYLALGSDALSFTYDTWLGSRIWNLPRQSLVAAYLTRRALSDVLEVYYQRGQRSAVARFVFMKDRTPLAEQLVALLGAAASSATPLPPRG